jgi:hypothetical protein
MSFAIVGNGFGKKRRQIVTNKVSAFVSVSAVAVKDAEEDVRGAGGEVCGYYVGVLIWFVCL